MGMAGVQHFVLFPFTVLLGFWLPPCWLRFGGGKCGVALCRLRWSLRPCLRPIKTGSWFPRPRRASVVLIGELVSCPPWR
ncbi:hypothetical protein PIB30_046009 [Stylosanthes scabra]|uniref:Secreted protein n=1 Tax=Stylosanthes scabra TaxID=79078 RepID=A0ABU6VIJ0_9FABA|nr:hypothetical protein [Stylosanthes scabra]